MKEIPDGSVDLVLCDPPYGTIGGSSAAISWKDRGQKNEWDVMIPVVPMFDEISRILRPNGKCVLFAQEPYTSNLVTNSIPAMPFSYRAIWKKEHAGNMLGCSKAMVNMFEDVCVFSKTAPKHDFNGKNPLRDYFACVLKFIEKRGDGRTGKQLVMDAIGGKADHTTRVNSSQFSLCTEQTYQELVNVFGIDEMDGFRCFESLRGEEDAYRSKLIDSMNEENPSTFNLWHGGKSKSNVLEYPKDRDHYHPTQKPVALLEDLIQTFSNPGDNVLDFTMGSGSTGVACVNTGRDFIGIELDEGYFGIAQKRISDAESQIRMAVVY